jgi:branched-chain amino acid transport system substrate-binding protein
MSDTKVALLVGCSHYESPEFPPLPAQQNIHELESVLVDKEIGDFRVVPLLNKDSAETSRRIQSFFTESKPDDLLLLYFSGHGRLDPTGHLYFTTPDTNEELLDTTALSAQRVQQWMDQGRARRIVLLLDCCYSGAFKGGLTRGSADTKEIIDQLSGHGRVVIAASGKLELAHDSVFTDAMVKGLRTGAADLDGDGRVSVHELFFYVLRQVRERRPGQTPQYSADDVSGELYLANNPQAPSPLPADLDEALRSPIAWVRRGAVDGLRRLLTGDNPGGQKRTARQALELLRDKDTDRDVRAAASEALSTVSRQPGIPDPRRPRRRRLVGVGLALVVALVLFIVPILTSRPSPPCSPSIKSADGVLSFGTLLPKTGDFVSLGPAMDAGVHLAMKDINDAGGIPGMAVKLDDANQRDEGNPSADTASQSVDALLSGGVDVIIGPSTSPVAIKVIDKITCAGVIMFSPGNESPVFTTYPSHGLYFRTISSTVIEGSVLGKLVVADGNSTAVVMSSDDVYGKYLREATGQAFQQAGGRVLDSFPYNSDALDKDLQRVKAMNPDAIIVINLADGPHILVQMIKDGLGPRNKRVYYSVPTNTLAGEVSPRNPGVLAGMRGTSPYAGDEAFAKRLREANPGLRDLPYAAQAYDAVVITALAAAVAGTDAPAEVAKQINDVTRKGESCTSFAACMTLVKDHKGIAYAGPSGPLRFTDHGEPSAATYVISEIQPDGTVKPLRSERASL